MISLFESLLPSGKPARRHWGPGSRLLVIALFALMSLSATERGAKAQTWSLTKAQRQSYLNYYAPVILKRGDENNNKQGHDWLASFDYDQDDNFSNNRANWLGVEHYIEASAVRDMTSFYSRWRIRPTLYTALLESMEGGSKSLVLLYHVYNAADKDGSEIHDWERIEIIVRGVNGTPGAAGESVNTVTVTKHSEQIMRRYYDAGLNFMQTATGKHVLIWQADDSEADIFSSSTHAHELRFVENPYSWITTQISSGGQAEVNINGKDEKKNVHYVFVPEGSPAAASSWGARPLTFSSANALYSGVDNGDTVAWSRVKRLTYELQDWADIVPTQWQYGPWYKHWVSNEHILVLLESPILNEAGQPEVSAGMQLFYTLSRDSASSSLTDGRDAYLSNFWFYGAYSSDPGSDADDFNGYNGWGSDSYGRTRGAASGYYDSHGAYWWQHDYFVHSGEINSSVYVEGGQWLPGAWYTAENGGFDGRWVALFDDRPGQEAAGALTLSVSLSELCGDPRTVYAMISGGQPPYTVTWTNATPISSPSDPLNQARAYKGAQVSVTVLDAMGATRSGGLTVPLICREFTGGTRPR